MNDMKQTLEIVRQNLSQSMIYKVATVASVVTMVLGFLIAFGVFTPDTDGIGYLMMALSIISQWGNANNPNVKGSYSALPNPVEREKNE